MLHSHEQACQVGEQSGLERMNRHKHDVTIAWEAGKACYLGPVHLLIYSDKHFVFPWQLIIVLRNCWTHKYYCRSKKPSNLRNYRRKRPISLLVSCQYRLSLEFYLVLFFKGTLSNRLYSMS